MDRLIKNKSAGGPIVSATDFSEPSLRANDLAAAIAIRLGVDLALIHGVDERGELPQTAWNSMKEIRAPLLHHEALRLRNAGAKVREVMAGGAPDDGLVVHAERANARLIVLAGSSHGIFGRWILGSVSEQVAQTAWIPTLILRDGSRLEDWARGGRPLRVFIGADFTLNSDAALDWAESLLEIGPCTFTVGFVDTARGASTEFSPGGGRNSHLLEMLTHDLRERAIAHLPQHDLNVRVLPTEGSVETHLLEMAAEACAELIVVGSHQWHGLSRYRHRSISRRLLHTAPVSLACVPAYRVVSAEAACQANVRNVVVATDLTTHGSAALPYGFADLQLGGTLIFVHVALPGASEESQKSLMRNLIPAEAEPLGFHIRTEVIEGNDIPTAICDFANRVDAGLICIGSRNSARHPRGRLGATAKGILAASERPVLVVPHACLRTSTTSNSSL